MQPFEHPLMDAIGLPVAEDVHAPLSLPVFDNSGMDGYAVAFKDVADATAERPLHLPVVGEIAAGQTQIFTLTPGTAVRIMTGAPDPRGVHRRRALRVDRGVRVARCSSAGHPRRASTSGYAGEEVKQGDLLMQPGRGDRHPPASGCSRRSVSRRVPTAPRPRVVVMSTGSELVEPGRPLGRDSIYDANSYLLAAAVRSHGAIAYRVKATSDDPAAFSEALSDQLGQRRPRRDQWRRQQGHPRRGQGGAQRARHRRVPRGGDAARQAAGLRCRRRGRHPDLHAAGQPGLGVRLLRDVRGARPPQAHRSRHRRPAPGHRHRHHRGAVDAGQAAAGARRGRARCRGSAGHPGRWRRLAPDRRPRRRPTR